MISLLNQSQRYDCPPGINDSGSQPAQPVVAQEPLIEKLNRPQAARDKNNKRKKHNYPCKFSDEELLAQVKEYVNKKKSPPSKKKWDEYAKTKKGIASSNTIHKRLGGFKGVAKILGLDYHPRRGISHPRKFSDKEMISQLQEYKREHKNPASKFEWDIYSSCTPNVACADTIETHLGNGSWPKAWERAGVDYSKRIKQKPIIRVDRRKKGEKYSDEHVYQKVKDFVGIFGYVPTGIAWRVYSKLWPGVPSLKYVSTYLGFKNVLIMAGYKPREIKAENKRIKRNRYWVSVAYTIDYFKSRINNFISLFGRVPAKEEYIIYISHLSVGGSISTFKRHFGNFEKGLKEMGFELPPKGLTEGQLKERVVEVAERLNKRKSFGLGNKY